MAISQAWIYAEEWATKLQEFLDEPNKFKDICDVISCQELFIKIDRDVFKGAGTVSEITFGCVYNKPMVYWMDGIKMKDIPGWVQGCLCDAKKVSGIRQAIDYYLCRKIICYGGGRKIDM